MHNKLNRIDTFYIDNNTKKYQFIPQGEEDQHYEKELVHFLDKECEYMILTTHRGFNDVLLSLFEYLSEYIIEFEYIKNLVLYDIGKQYALKIKYSREVIKKIRNYFSSRQYFPFFHEQIDACYYKSELCLLVQVGEYRGIYILDTK